MDYEVAIDSLRTNEDVQDIGDSGYGLGIPIVSLHGAMILKNVMMAHPNALKPLAEAAIHSTTLDRGRNSFLLGR